MTPVMVDSNVILDVLIEDPVWESWSRENLASAAVESMLVINPIVYAEVSVGLETIEELDYALPPGYFRREDLPWEAAFLAGKSYLEYRRRGGVKRSPLPDFFIGAHAAIRGYRLLTRDSRRYKTYFPKLRLIAPDG